MKYITMNFFRHLSDSEGFTISSSIVWSNQGYINLESNNFFSIDTAAVGIIHDFLGYATHERRQDESKHDPIDKDRYVKIFEQHGRKAEGREKEKSNTK